MEKCCYYHISKQDKPKSKEQTSTRQQMQTLYNEIPFCAHPSEEFGYDAVMSRKLFSSSVLQCGGEINNCQLQNNLL